MIHLPVNNHVITSRYGWRILNGSKQWHNGLDLISLDNNNVFNMYPGVVVYDQDDYDHSLRWMKGHTGGNMIIVRSTIEGTDYFIRYLHLAENYIEKGQQVQAGDLIGIYGDVGRSYGAHVHVDVWSTVWKEVDPAILQIPDTKAA